MTDGGSSGHRRALLTATAATLVAWVVAWKWIGGLSPLHAYLPQALNMLSGSEGTLLVAGGIVQTVLICAIAPAIVKAWTEEHDKTITKVLARRDVLYAVLGFLAAELALALAFGALDFHPITEDEKTYLFQARLLLSGHLTIPEAPEQRSFMQPFLVARDGLVSGQYFWAQPAFVAIGEAIGLPWLAIGFQVALAVYFTGKLAADLADDGRVGLVASAIVASSPLVISTGATLHNANLALACSAAALWGLVKIVQQTRDEDAKPAWKERLPPTLALGISTGLALNNRLLDHAALLAAAVIVLVVAERKRIVRIALAIVPAVGLSLPFIVALLLTNRAVTGSPFITGYHLFNDGHGWKTMGFGEGPFGVERTVSDAAANQLSIWALLTYYVSGSPFALLLLGPAAFSGRSRRLHLIGAALFVCAFYTTAYFFYCGASVTQTGPIYYDALMPVLATAIAIAAVDLHEIVVEAKPEWRRLVPALLVAQTIAGLVVLWPSQLAEMFRLRGSAASCEELVASHNIKKALVFVRGDRPVHDSWVAHPPLPHPKLDDDVLFVKLRPFQDTNMAVAKAYAKGRPIYLAVCIHTPEQHSLAEYDPATQATKPLAQ